MHQLRIKTPVIGAMLVAPLLAAAIAAPAAAQSIVRQNAAGMCQGALPQFAGTLRARPLGVINEGGSSAFVTCSLPGVDGVSHNMEIIITNRGSSDQTINCTAVSGRVLGAAPVYVPLTGTVSPGQIIGLFYNPAGGDLGNMLNLSCSLPPMTELSYIRRNEVTL
jgi:hypothetical protein